MSEYRSLSIALDALGDNDAVMRRVADHLLGGPNPGVNRHAEVERVRSVVYALATVLDESAGEDDQ